MNRKGPRIFSGQYNQILCLLAMVSLLVGMVGPVQYLPAHEVQAQGVGVTLDGTVSVATADDVQTVEVPHTTGTGANRLLVVGVSWNSDMVARTISSVTFTPDGGSAVALSPVVTRDHGTTTPYRYAAIYGLVNPPSGRSGKVNVTFTGGTVTAGIAVGVANFAGVDQTTPFGVTGGAYSSTNNTTPTVTLSGLNGDELVIDTLFLGGNPPATVNPGAGQTQLGGWNATIANARGAASIEQATSSSVTMSWTASASSLWVIVAAAIRPAFAGATYDLTVAVDPPGGGTTVPPAGTHEYPENTVVDVTATAAPGYAFDRWEGACTGTDPDGCQVTMTEDKAVTAYFAALPQYTLTVDSTGIGSVTLDPASGTYLAGTMVTLTPAPGHCHVFSGWSGTDAADLTDNGDGTWSITMDGNKSVTAEFPPLPPGTPCYRVNCGGDTLTEPEPDFLGLHYPGLDTVPGLTVSNVQEERSTTDIIDMSNVDPGLPMALFQTVLVRGTAGQTMSFDFAVPNGDYDVLLHFAEHYFSSAGQRAFDITVEDVLAFKNYDIFVAAGGEDIAVTEKVATTVSDGVLSIDITARVSDAAIRGIEIVPAGEVCHALTLGRTGNGATPVADPTNSSGCPAGQYVAGAVVSLTASPASGWTVGSWTGTDNDDSTSTSNQVTMPAAGHTVTVNYVGNPTGQVVSSATPSDAEPKVGDQVVVTINVDMSGVDSPNHRLGSYTGSLTWDPAILDYVSHQGPPAGFTGAVNTADADDGSIIFNGAYSDGATGNVGILQITFDVVGPGTTALDLSYSAMSAAVTFVDLVPILTVNDGQVEATCVIYYMLTMAVGSTGGGTTDPGVGSHSYVAGTVVDITATPNTGYRFDYWEGDVADPDSASTTVTMNMDKTVTAHFVDNVPPDTTITDQPANPSASPNASFSFSSEAGSTFECRLDGSAFGPCTSPQTYTGLADGEHTFEVRAIDAAGNPDPTPATYTWTIDTVAPNTTITDQPNDPSNSPNASFDFNSNETGATFECRLDDGPYGLCTSPQTYTGLADGKHTFEVRATDAAGNIDPTPATYTWTIDTVVPDTTITDGPANPSASPNASFSFTSTKPGSTFECQLDGGGFSACASPRTYTGLADGEHTFQVRAIDAMGTPDPTPATYTWTIDTVAPDTTITSHPDERSHSADASFGFTSNETGATFECRLDDGPYGLCTSPQTYTGLNYGIHTFEVRAIDAAGNPDPTPASFVWTIFRQIFLPIVLTSPLP